MSEVYDSLATPASATIAQQFEGNSEAKRDSFDPASLDKESALYVHPPYIVGDMSCALGDLSGGIKSGSTLQADQDPKPYLPTGNRYGSGSFGGV